MNFNLWFVIVVYPSPWHVDWSGFPISLYVNVSLILFITKGLPQLVVANVASHVASSFPTGARFKFPWLRCISPHQWIYKGFHIQIWESIPWVSQRGFLFLWKENLVFFMLVVSYIWTHLVETCNCATIRLKNYLYPLWMHFYLFHRILVCISRGRMYIYFSKCFLQRDIIGLTTENNELKLWLRAMEKQAQLQDGMNDYKVVLLYTAKICVLHQGTLMKVTWKITTNIFFITWNYGY